MIERPAHLKLVEYARLEGEANMDLDRRLLALCEANPEYGFLRFYTWARPTLSMGRLEPDDAVDRTAAERDGIAVVKRPTGGRVVLHGDDLTYAVVVPRPTRAGLQKTYNLFSEILVDGLSSMGAPLDMERGKTGRSRMVQRPCFASVSRYEVTYKGRKVVGSAQRVGQRAVLQHGSIPLGTGYLRVVDYMSVSSDARERLRDEMEAGTSCLEAVLGRCVEARQAAGALTGAFRRRLGCDFEPVAVADVDACMPGDRGSRKPMPQKPLTVLHRPLYSNSGRKK
jgi:lipoate-protein ligase A